ncbi:MAG: M15 family metallopeptidase [Armatimonadota bacterium]
MAKLKNIFILLFILTVIFTFMAKAEEINNNKTELVDISSLDSSIQVDLKYASGDNVFGEIIYPANKAYLQKPVAEKLIKIQEKLNKKGYSLKIWDAYRPLSVQKLIWKIKPDSMFVANPATGSNHNRGCAVDATLTDKNGNEIPMPTKFDDFSPKASPDYNNLSKDIIKNRDLLIKVFKEEGFVQYKNEWWHFNYKDAKQYPVLDISFEELSEDAGAGKKEEEKIDIEKDALDKVRIIFDLSDIKDSLDFLDSMPLYEEKSIYTYRGIKIKNEEQDFYLIINPPNIVLFNKEKSELVLLPTTNIMGFVFIINDEITEPKESIFSLAGRADIRSEVFALKSRGFNWQENEGIIKIRVFRWK